MKSEQLNRIALAAILIISFEGCASMSSVNISAVTLPKPVSMNSQINREYSVIKHVKIEQHIPFLFAVRLVPKAAQFDMRKMLMEDPDVKEGDAIINVTVKGEAAFGDIILPIGIGIAGAFLVPPLTVVAFFPLFEDLKTYTIEGDVVRYKETIPPIVPQKKFDPLTGLPIQESKQKFDPDTGLPIPPKE